MPSRFQAEDGTGTTIKSPLAVADTEIDMVVPDNAVAIVVRPVAADVRIAITDGGTAAAPYKVVTDGNIEKLPVAGLTSLHFLRDAAVSLTLHFHFEIVG